MYCSLVELVCVNVCVCVCVYVDVSYVPFVCTMAILPPYSVPPIHVIFS